MASIKESRITQDQFTDFSQPFVLDLIALFNLVEEDTVKTISKAQREGWTPDKLIKEVEKII